MNLFRKLIAEKRRPDSKGESFLEWTLISNRFLHLTLICFTQSEDKDDFRPSESAHALVALHGDYMLVQQERVYDREIGQMLTAEVVTHFYPPSFHFFDAADLYHIELYPPEKYEDSILDMPRWMSVNDVLMDTRKQAWFLTWSWSWKGSITSR